MRTLYLFTEYYPTGDKSLSEHAFVSNEINYLKEKFTKVIVIPSLILPEQKDIKIKGEIDYTLAIKFKKTTKLQHVYYSILSKFFYREIINKGLFFWTPRKLKRLFYVLGRAIITRKWVVNKAKQISFNSNNTLFYTFWITGATWGLSSQNNLQVITRAHGHDLYEEYYGYMPGYKYIIDNVNSVYLVSKAAVEYLQKRFAKNAKKIHLNHLGVKKAVSLSTHSSDRTIRICSCSYVIKRKRVHLILEGIIEFIKKNKLPINWVHFGDGPEISKVRQKAMEYSHELFEFQLMGNKSNDEILNYYANNPVDLFMMTTDDEGGVPVALQEAQAHGIPIIGTDVGGIPDILKHKEVGFLLNSNPTPDEIADAIYYVISDHERFLSMRESSLKNWEENFNEQKNYQRFSSTISQLIPE